MMKWMSRRHGRPQNAQKYPRDHTLIVIIPSDKKKQSKDSTSPVEIEINVVQRDLPKSISLFVNLCENNLY